MRPFILPAFVIVLSAAFIALGWGLNAKHRTTWKGAVPVVLDVIEVQSTTIDFSTVYRPVFEMTLASGQNIQSAPELWSFPNPHRIGYRVDGYYIPKTQQLISNKIRRKSSRFGKVFIWVGILIGVVFGPLVWSINRPTKR